MNNYVYIQILRSVGPNLGQNISNLNTREFNTREVVWFVGHNFLGCGSYDLGIWQDFSPMSPLPSYTY